MRIGPLLAAGVRIIDKIVEIIKKISKRWKKLCAVTALGKQWKKKEQRAVFRSILHRQCCPETSFKQGGGRRMNLMMKRLFGYGLAAALSFAVLGVAPVAAQDTMSNDAFFDLCVNGTVEEVRKVIRNGTANLHARTNGATALMMAAGNNSNPQMVKMLLDNGLDVNARDTGGMTALMYAAWKNPNPEVVKVLLERGADIRAADRVGHDALWWAQQSPGGWMLQSREAKEKIIQILKEYVPPAKPAKAGKAGRKTAGSKKKAKR